MSYITHTFTAALGLVAGALMMGLLTTVDLKHQHVNREGKGDRLLVIPEQLRQ